MERTPLPLGQPDYVGNLSPAQNAALAAVRERARLDRPQAVRRIEAVLDRTRVAVGTDELLAAVRSVGVPAKLSPRLSGDLPWLGSGNASLLSTAEVPGCSTPRSWGAPPGRRYSSRTSGKTRALGLRRSSASSAGTS